MLLRLTKVTISWGKHWPWCFVLCSALKPTSLLCLLIILFSVLQGTREEKQENGLKTQAPAINLMGSNEDKMGEAREWIQRILTLQDQHIIENNHILYLGKKEHDILSQLQKTTRVQISEIISPGKAILQIRGAQADLIEVVMNIEHMLCEVQEEMARKKEQALWSLSSE